MEMECRYWHIWGTQTFNISPNFDVFIDWAAYDFPLFGNARGLPPLFIALCCYRQPHFEDFDGGNGALSTFAQESSFALAVVRVQQ